MLGLVIWVERRFRIRRGYLIAAYASFYTFGRFWTEYLRIDNAHRFLGLRLNDWTSILVFVVSTVVLLTRGRAGPGDDCAGTRCPRGHRCSPEPDRRRRRACQRRRRQLAPEGARPAYPATSQTTAGPVPSVG